MNAITMPPTFTPTAAALRAALEPLPPTTACNCPLKRVATWDSVSEGDWPQATMQPLASLRDPSVAEPTFEEHHPQGTRYDSPNAPIAPRFFPFNRCEASRCTRCGQDWLRYTEYGGYYIDHRVRRLELEWVTDD